MESINEYEFYANRIETRFVKEPDFPFNEDTVFSNPADVYDFVRHTLRYSDVEKTVFAYLSATNKLIGIKIYEGTVDQVVLYPREIIKIALLTGATALIMVHNHPSGNLNPSPEDHNLTKTIKETCKLFSIHVHDHLIVNEEGYYSFTEGMKRGVNRDGES
jgi:DNA repair protein RadC